MIIVSNTLASEFFRKRKKTKHSQLDKIWKKETTFNSEIGTYEIKLNNRFVPIVISGMLSGQRSINVGDFERLKWQAKMILQGKKMK